MIIIIHMEMGTRSGRHTNPFGSICLPDRVEEMVKDFYGRESVSVPASAKL
jgi:hypothetical protein